jgi:hypothetical protein
VEGESWLRRAAEQGNTEAGVALAPLSAESASFPEDAEPAEELLSPDEVASLDRLMDLRTPLDEVFSDTERAMLSEIQNVELRNAQELGMRAEKARLMRATLENLASMRRQMMQMMESEDDEAGDGNTQEFGAHEPTPAPKANPSVPAGWYPDATEAHLWRWWDGKAWTHHTAPR